MVCKSKNVKDERTRNAGAEFQLIYQQNIQVVASVKDYHFSSETV